MYIDLKYFMTQIFDNQMKKKCVHKPSFRMRLQCCN